MPSFILGTLTRGRANRRRNRRRRFKQRDDLYRPAKKPEFKRPGKARIKKPPSVEAVYSPQMIDEILGYKGPKKRVPRNALTLRIRPDRSPAPAPRNIPDEWTPGGKDAARRKAKTKAKDDDFDVIDRHDNCKERPQKTKGKGGSRPFAPWCDRDRKRK